MGIILNELKEKIQELESQIGYSLTSDVTLLTGHLMHCKQLSNEIKAQVQVEGLGTKQDEITFFKEVKPQLTSLYYYYRRALDIVHQVPATSVTVKERVLQDERRKLDHFALNNQDLQCYLKRGLKHNDELYYTRKWDDTELFADYRLVDLDQTYSTRKGFKTARLLAHPYLYQFIEQQIRALRHTPDSVPSTEVQWVGKKVNLVTLIYGLIETKQVDADVSKLAHLMSDVFSVDLNNIYGMWQDIKMRKKEKLPFIKELIEVLSNKIDEEM